MLFSTVTRLVGAVALAAASATANYLDKDVYMKNVAVDQLARISNYRTEHANLTDAQGAALDLMENVVKYFDVNSWQDARDACVAAFGKDECLHFTAQSPGSNLAARASDCKCATLDSWCDKKCVLRKNKCGYGSYGCGFLLIYPCDGLCS